MFLTVSLLLGLAGPPMPADSVPQRVSLLPLPLIYYTPETRLAYGAALTATFRFNRDLDALRLSHKTADSVLVRPSQITFGVAYTQNQQLLFYLPFQLFYTAPAHRRNRYFFTGEAGYYRYSYYFFGVGQREVPRELYGVDYPRIRLNAFRQIADLNRGKLYAGLRYQYEAYRVTATEATGLLTTGAVPGGRGSRLSGGGLGLFYDSRDQVFFPRRGVVADLTGLLRNRATALNPAEAATTFDRYAADVSSYHALGVHTVLAVNYFASFTAGVAPFNAMSLLGGTKRMRGYYEGRYRDKNAALLQTELRFDIYKRLGAVVFGAVGILGDDRQLLRTNDPKGAYGAGLRFTVNRRDHLNIRVDYGFGNQSSGLYITIGEAF